MERIFSKPGRKWTPRERQSVIDWLNKDPQLHYLLRFGLFKLGPKASAQNAEDAWQDFCLEKLSMRIDRYDPGKGRPFFYYLVYLGKQNWDSFENFCLKKRKKIEKELASLEDLVVRRASQRDEVVRARLQRAQASLFPGGQWQERSLCPFYFLMKYGRDFIQRLEECVTDADAERPDFRLLFLDS